MLYNTERNIEVEGSVSILIQKLLFSHLINFTI
jgi:hypothetical protein